MGAPKLADGIINSLATTIKEERKNNMGKISLALFNNDKKSDKKHPDYRGKGKVTKDDLLDIVKALQTNEEVPLTIAAWRKTSSNGNSYLSISVQLDE